MKNNMTNKNDELTAILNWLVQDHLDIQGMDSESKEIWENDKHAAIAKLLQWRAESVLAILPEKKDMSAYEGVTEDGGIDTTIYDDIDDARGVKNGEMLAHLSQFVADTTHNQTTDDIKELLLGHQDKDSREAQMIVTHRNEQGKPTVWCDPEIVDLVKALNDGGVPTIASCSGHGERNGNIMLKDGRELIIANDFDDARCIENKITTSQCKS